MSQHVHIIGVGMSPFAKPGKSLDYPIFASQAGKEALKDAGILYQDVQQGYAGYVYGDSTCGNRVFYELGLNGIPIFNVNNNCSTGSTALMLAAQAIAGGQIECALVIGFEQMQKGALGAQYTDRINPLAKHIETMFRIQGKHKGPIAAQMFGGAGQEYQKQYGTRAETFGKIAEKSRKHAVHNPFAIFNSQLSLDEIMNSPSIFAPLTRLQCCPPTCGAAAAVLCSETFARKHGLRKTITIRAQAMRTDFASSFSSSMQRLIGFDMAQAAANAVFEQSGVDPKDIDVVELHDCFTTNELLSYEALGLCKRGGAEQFIWDNDNTYGGQVVINPSGGLLSKGHPLGATGVAQCAELVWQLRGAAEQRQVEGATLALQHNLGLGGACVVTLYEAQG